MITTTQKRIYNFLKAYYLSNQVSPKMTEICERVGMRSPASVHAHIVVLEREGLIRRTPRIKRGISIVEAEETS